MKFCERPFNMIHMLPGGDVWTCGWMHLPIGNIITQELSEIWNSKNAQLARESILDGSFRYCNKMSCPFCNNDTLPELSDDEMKAVKPAETPIHIRTAFDYVCNHACPSCRSDIYKPNEQYIENLDISINKITPYLSKAKIVEANGNGDLFANPRILNMLASVKPENDDFFLGIETNGSLFTPQNWAKISHLGKYGVEVTVTPNSFERDTFTYLSGGVDDLDKLIENLHFIKDLRKSGEINKFNISIVVQDRNFRELPSFTQRCLDEFETDEVTIKPVYQWFGMTEDVYWFKNIRNPLHPYHNEWLKIMKDPILDDPRVFHWGGREPTEARNHPMSKYKTNQNILLKLIKYQNSGALLKEKLSQYKRIAICSPDDEIGNFTAKTLKENEVDACFLRRFAPDKDSIDGLSAYGFPDMDFKSVDAIIITDIYNYQKLKKDIENHNFKGKIVSLDELVKEL